MDEVYVKFTIIVPETAGLPKITKRTKQQKTLQDTYRERDQLML